MDPISPRNLKLLQSYFDARCDIFLLAQREKLAVLDLIRWSQSPAVASHIAALKTLTDDSIHLRTAQARLLSLDTLEKIVRTTDDPLELRRAASTLYRGGAAMPQPRAPRKPDPDNPPPRSLPRKYHKLAYAQSPGFHPPYIPPRPTPHDSFTTPVSAPPPSHPRVRSAQTPRLPRASRSVPPIRLPAIRSDIRAEGRSGGQTAPARTRSRPVQSTAAPPYPRPQKPKQPRGTRDRQCPGSVDGPSP